MARVSQFLPRIVLFSGLLAVLAIYSMAWSGTLHFDDETNLDGLYGIADWSTAVQFVFSGESGPTGRPLSLASFALQYHAWPDPEPFLIFNTGLHLINAILCFLLITRILRWVLPEDRSAEWIALTVTLLWAVSPLLASTSLMVVQRMTGLSAFFVLLFLVFYVQLRSAYLRESTRSNLVMTCIVGAGTLLAGFSKENGFLLPVFVLLVEWLIVPRCRNGLQRLSRAFSLIVLVAPVVGIIGYLIYRGFVSSGYQFRDFTMLERLLTQPAALMDYLRHLVLPDPDAMSPFHDNFPVSSGLLSPPATTVAVIGVLALLSLAWLLRHSFPLVALGVFWFFAGHVLESTTLPLELYFPHRNYLPAVGLYLALVYGFYAIFQRLLLSRYIRVGAASGYFLVFSVVLAYGTSLWGNHRLASEMWYIHNRDSVRASIYLYSFYANEGDADLANQLNERFMDDHPGNALFTLQALGVCDAEASIYERKVERAASDLVEASILTVNHTGIISKLAARASDSNCQHLGVDVLKRLIDSAYAKGKRRIHPNARIDLLFAKAQIAEQSKDYEAAVNAMRSAMEIRANLDTAVFVAYFLVEGGNVKAAVDYLENEIREPSVNGQFRKAIWRIRLSGLLEDLQGRRPDRSGRDG